MLQSGRLCVLLYQGSESGKVRVRPRTLRGKEDSVGQRWEVITAPSPVKILFSVQWVSPNKESGFFIYWVFSYGSTGYLSVETEIDFPAASGQMGPFSTALQILSEASPLG